MSRFNAMSESFEEVTILITCDGIKLPPDGYLDIESDALNYGAGDCCSMNEFMEKYPAKIKPPKNYER